MQHKLGFRIAAGAALVLLVSCAAPSAAGGLSDAEVSARVRRTLADQTTAWNMGDVRGFMDGYRASDATTFVSGTTLERGHANLLERFLKRYPEGKMGKLEFTELEVHPLDGEAAYAFARYKLSGDTQQTGMFTLIFKRDGDRFVIVHDHTTSDPKPQTQN
jgi:ketosteroid isomerase-like protein